jgi:hypothetical protein
MYQTNEQFEPAIASQRSPLQTKEATPSYEEDGFDSEPCTDFRAWLSGRLSCIEYATDQTLKIPPTAPEYTFEMSRWNSVFGINLSASMTQKNPIRIELPQRDWSWCADPL